jgi:hypothetical protein
MKDVRVINFYRPVFIPSFSLQVLGNGLNG